MRVGAQPCGGPGRSQIRHIVLFLRGILPTRTLVSYMAMRVTLASVIHARAMWAAS